MSPVRCVIWICSHTKIFWLDKIYCKLQCKFQLISLNKAGKVILLSQLVEDTTTIFYRLKLILQLDRFSVASGLKFNLDSHFNNQPRAKAQFCEVNNETICREKLGRRSDLGGDIDKGQICKKKKKKKSCDECSVFKCNRLCSAVVCT